ncbi:unnamed protein product [Chrysoparadoxa australica]
MAALGSVRCRAFSIGVARSVRGGRFHTTETEPVHGGVTPPPPTKTVKTTVMDVLRVARESNRKLTMATAYSYPSALHVCRAGMDMLLVGDSVGMVELGYDTTQPVTVEEMLHHCKAVARGAKTPLLIGDLPFGSYEASPEQAHRTAIRFVKEGSMDAVKLEGGASRVEHIRRIVDGGIAVVGHVGLTPQSISVLGGFRAQGRTAVKARQLVDDALAVQDAGAFAVVVECVPSTVAKAITDAVEIPTIGIGAGGSTSGQVLVYHDMLGMLQHPHHAQFVPKFCKRFANVGEQVNAGLLAYRAEVESGVYPGSAYSPYTMSSKEEHSLAELLAKDELERQEKLALARKKLHDQDEYEVTKLY